MSSSETEKSDNLFDILKRANDGFRYVDQDFVKRSKYRHKRLIASVIRDEK